MLPLTSFLCQLGPLVGASMLIVATTVFLYYTIWTLLMVHYLSSPVSMLLRLLTFGSPALRRLVAPLSIALPPSCLGHPSPCHSHPGRRCCGWLFPVPHHDQEQPPKGSQSSKGEGKVASNIVTTYLPTAPFYSNRLDAF